MTHFDGEGTATPAQQAEIAERDEAPDPLLHGLIVCRLTVNFRLARAMNETS